MTIDPAIDITVVICTRNRAESLRETLGCLIRADRTGLRCEVIVVDNASTDHTPAVAAEAGREIPVRHVVEPALGKSHCLARATTAFPLGQIVAVLDDDMSPHEDWFQGVQAICRRRPDAGFFAGHSYVIWPGCPVPDWCRHPSLLGWAYSVLSCGDEREVETGRWFSGNHYWFRSRLLSRRNYFTPSRVSLQTHIEMCDANLMLDLAEDGAPGICAPDAKCGHRLQEELLEWGVLKRRAARVGRGFAEAHLRPPKRRVKQSRLFARHPLAARAFCLASALGWALRWGACSLHPVTYRRRPGMLQAMERYHRYREYLHVASSMVEYRPFQRRNSAAIGLRSEGNPGLHRGEPATHREERP